MNENPASPYEWSGGARKRPSDFSLRAKLSFTLCARRRGVQRVLLEKPTRVTTRDSFRATSTALTSTVGREDLQSAERFESASGNAASRTHPGRKVPEPKQGARECRAALKRPGMISERSAR